MGCFNLQGCISQLPICDQDRVAGILCRIVGYNESSNNDNHLIGDFQYIPMCPIIYGVYDEYGSMIPDKSLTTDILEEFFNTDISTIVDVFSRISLWSWDESYINILKPLLFKRNNIKDIPDISSKLSSEFFFNRYCIVYEHESIIRKIIESNDDMMKNLTYRIKRHVEDNWSKMYDEQRAIFINNKLDDINALCNYNIKWEDSSLLFPSKHNNIYRGVYASEYMMDLFQNYPDMFHYAFDINLKDEYLDTLKFYNVITHSQIKMNLNRDIGRQFANISLWNDLIPEYQKIINNKKN